MIRVFLGIPASEELKEKISLWAEGYKDWPLRWVSGNGLHITLVQPWYAPACRQAGKTLDCWMDKLDDLAKATGPIKIKFKKVTFGTNPAKPRLVWTIGEDYDREAMIRLKTAAEAVFGQRLDIRSYSPHLTIARFKEEDFENLPDKNLNDSVDWEMEVGSVALYESKLQHSGAEYEILKEIKLVGSE